jgi:hypothetical protein
MSTFIYMLLEYIEESSQRLANIVDKRLPNWLPDIKTLGAGTLSLG